MLTPLSLTFFQGGRTIRRIRSATQRRIQDEPAIRLLHSLLDITITPTPVLSPGLVLTHKGGIALCGPPSSGRSLSLLQIQARWADSGSSTPLIALNLSTDDVPNLSPRAVVAGAIHRASLAAIYGEGNRPMVLLIDDWEDLPADRRTLWRSYVLAAATWATARVVISLPLSEEWPGLTSIALTAPADDMLETWIGRLLPGHDSAPIMAALQQEPLAELRNHIGDLLLLALIYPIIGLPVSRSQLYEQAYALARPVLNGTNGQICVGRATLRYYRLARSFVSGADLATMIDLPDHEIAAVAPLAAGLLDDPRPVLKLLWANGKPSQAGLYGLAKCLRERPSAAPEQYLPFVRLLMTQEDYELRTLITPALPDLLAIVSHSDIAQSSSVLNELATSWPPTEAINLLLRLIGHTNAARELRWAAADILAGWQNLPNNIAHLPADADEITRAAYAYIIALAAPTLRQLLLHAALRPGLDSLIAGSGGDQRWANVATALTADPACPNELHALVLTKAPAQPEGTTLIQSALTERSPALRHSALAALETRPATEVLHLLGTALDNTGHNDDVVHDLLAHIARLPQLEATGLIARYALNDQGGTIARIIALRLIARRPGGVALLQRFLAAEHMPTPLRAAAARLLGMAGDVTNAPHLRRTMLNDGPPIVRRAAVDALAALAQTPGGKDGAVASLIDAIARPEIDATLTCHIATALGAAGATMAMLALSTLLDPSRPAALRANWIAAVPELAHTPITQWATLPLSPHVRMILIDSLATGDTVADQPSSLDELAIRQAEQSATAAAESLARIAQQRPDLADDLCSRIRRTIIHTPWPHPPVGLLAALGRAAGEHSTDEIEQILNSPASTPALRWATLDQLGRNPAVIGWLQNRLYTGNDNVFIQGLIAALLGDLAAQEAVPTLRAITIDPVSDPRLREQTIVALGKIGNSEASIALLTLIKESSVPASLRAAAIDALSHPLSDTAYRTLRQIARAESGVPTLASAVSRRLARAGEREILPLLLRNAQSDQAEEAISAIEAIVHLGDQSAISLLVRISQSVTAAPSVRLTAIAALIQIEGATHLPLLRSYLDSPISPIRLHAHQILAQTEPSNATLVEPLADMDAPLALRLAAMDRMIAQSPDLNLIAAILSNSEESPQLRLNSTTALGDSGDPETIYALLDVLGTDSPPVLLHRCIAALGTLATTPGETGSIAQAGLVALAQANDSPAEICHWATQIILDHTFQEHIL